jgi:hypothetical protein
MQTHELIDALASGAGPARRAAAARRLVPAIVAGALASAGLAVGVLGPVPTGMLGNPALWIKLAYAAALALSAAWLGARRGRPAAPTARASGLVLAVFAFMLGLGLWSWWSAPPPLRSEALMGQTWSMCFALIVSISLPALAGSFWVLRGLAPTQPRAAGLAAGLLAGALGTMGYSLHCPESGLPFIAVWYSLGIALTGALGAALGPRFLRW